MRLRISLYFFIIRQYRETYGSFAVDVILLNSRMQIASTTLLLDGGREGEPPETKHRFVASWPTWQPLFFYLPNRPRAGWIVQE